MGVVTALAIGGAVAAAATAGSAVLKKKAAQKAAKAQTRGIDQQEALLRKNLDPGALNRLAQEVDRERALNRVALQTEVDPEIAELRNYSKKQLLALSQQSESSKKSTQVAEQLFEEGINADPKLEALKDTIIGRAQEAFDAGATLPPEFQAELVRAGVATGAQAGVGTSSRTIGGVTSRLLGSAGITLKQQRAQEGAALAGVADGLVRSRQQILQNIFPTVKVAEDAQYGRAVQGLGIAEGLLPESGISGNAAVDIEIARQKGFANLAQQRGQVAAQQAQTQGDFQAGLIGAGTGLAMAGVGAYNAGTATPGILGNVAGINYGSLSQSVIGPSNNPYFGAAPGRVPYTYRGDPTLLTTTRRI